jgi:hypothetical protein
MTREEQIVAEARAIALQELGHDAPEAIITVLARMVLVGSTGASAGFLRAPPLKPAELKLDDHKPL